jgi:hypothetical protein
MDIVLILYVSANKNALLSGFEKRPQGFFYENQSIRGFFGFESSFKTVFGIFLAPLVGLKSVK